MVNIDAYLEELDKPPKTNPKTQAIVTKGLVAASLVVPVPGLTLAVLQVSDLNMYKCRYACEKDSSELDKTLCYKECRYKASAFSVRWIQGELAKCKTVSNPQKCQKKLWKLLETWKQKHVENEIKYNFEKKKAKVRLAKSHAKNKDKAGLD